MMLNVVYSPMKIMVDPGSGRKTLKVTDCHCRMVKVADSRKKMQKDLGIH